MPQRNLRHSHYIYSNHSDNKLITLFATNLQPRLTKTQCFRAFPAFFSYSHSFVLFYQTVFSYSFRSFSAYHLMRFSSNSTRSESVVPKVYPDRVTTTSYFSKFVSHYHSSPADVEIYNSYRPLLFVLPSLHIWDFPDNSLYYIEDNNRTNN